MKRTKKLLKSVFAFVFLLPLVALCGCGATNYYSLSLLSSNINRGSVSPVLSGTFAEGSSVKLTATPASSSSNFLCWIKDYTTMVSNTTSYTFSVSSATAGTYIGLFDEANISSMSYFVLTDVEVFITGATQVSVQIDYATSKNAQTTNTFYSADAFEEIATLSNSSMSASVSQPSVLSFEQAVYEKDGVATDGYYLFSVSVSYTLPTGITYSLTASDLQLSYSSFSGETATIASSDVKLTFSKVTSSIVESIFAADE